MQLVIPPLRLVPSVLWSSVLSDLVGVWEPFLQQLSFLTEGGPCHGCGPECGRTDAPDGCSLSNSSYDDRSSDRRAYDRRHCGSYRRNDYSRDRGDAYYDADCRHSCEYHRENSSYRSQRSSRRKHRRRRRRSRTFSRSSSVSAGPALPLPAPSGTPVSERCPCAQLVRGA